MNIKYLKNFNNHKKTYSFRGVDIKVTNKQKLGMLVLLISICFTPVFAQYGSGSSYNTVSTKDIRSIINGVPGGGIASIAGFYLTSFSFLDIAKYTINYIVQSQNKGAQAIASMKFGSSNMFGTIYNGITIFAVIACGYKILMHYLKTERYDNVQAFTGFMSYAGALLLFIFSDSIVTRLTSLNSSINQSAIQSIGSKIDSELDQQIALDYENLVNQLKDIESEYASITSDSGSVGAIMDAGSIIRNRADFYGKQATFYAGNIGKYIYFSAFGVLITAVLAIPVFIMTLMVKILLSVMTFGTKIVFLLNFIPGFENTWKTFILNMLHILLWIPIFNAIIAFVLQIISATMVTGAMTGGQIVWLSIVSIICAYQAISLTTTAAGTIINGAGAGMAGAMGALTNMSAVNMAATAVTKGAEVAAAAATGGTSAIASKLSKS